MTQSAALDPVPGVERGEIFTRRWVVEMILDLAGYVSANDLGSAMAVEPACGDGAFLGPMIDRLIESCVMYGRDLTDLRSPILAVDVSATNVERARKLTSTRLAESGVTSSEAERLATGWVCQSDFLLLKLPESSADFVLGNPPYIRLENVPAELNAAYRAACLTMRGRSDVFVGFIERSLRLLRERGTLGFIVADRWMHNDYGSRLRKLVAADFSVDTVIELHEVDAFEDEVSAYPAVTILRRGRQGPAILASTHSGFGASDASGLLSWARSHSSRLDMENISAARMPGWFPGEEMWPSGNPSRLAVINELERRFPLLEDSGGVTRVGIGVATGADRVFITTDMQLVEEDRMLPVVMAKDTTSGKVAWSGTFLVNPWDQGKLVDLDKYPRFASYIRSQESRLRNRHIAHRQPRAWYRTIDRVDPELRTRAKLLLPDIKASSHPVLDEGAFYPHHNLYFIVSAAWDLEVLGGLLISKVAEMFVGAYCVKMRGGCYRFQAQYLRRIRIPAVASISRPQRRALARAFAERDVAAASAVAQKLYGIDVLP